MLIPVSLEVKRVFAEGNELAVQSGKPFDSSFLLLAFFTLPNKGLALLEERKIDEDKLIDAMRSLRGTVERHEAIVEVEEKMQQIAVGCHAELVSTLHLLIALCRVSQSNAYKVLRAAGVDPAELRMSTLAELTGPIRRRPSPPPAATSTASRRSVPAVTPALRPPTVVLDDVSPALAPPPAAEGAASVSTGFSGAADRAEKPSAGRTPFTLDPETYPTLCSLGRNLTEEAYLGILDPLVGRTQELETVIDILQKRRSNNPCILGDPGVGKTALVEGLARILAGVDGQSPFDETRVLVEINTSALIAGTHLRGSFAERMGTLKEEVRRAGGRLIVFIDEIHTLIGAGAGDGPLDASNDLKAALARGEFPCIGATTLREYKKYIESDLALERRFQPVILAEPGFDDALVILKGIVDRYEDHHQVVVRPEAMELAIRLSARYITDRCLPDKAINLVDLACARARRQRRNDVRDVDVAEVVSKQTQIPMDRLLLTDAERLLSMEPFLIHHVVGQQEPLRRIAGVIRRNYAGFNSHRPMGSFLLVGPTGVGKTETVKVLAEFLFQSRDAIARFDMSEYSEAHAVSKLVGSPPGYVGHDEGGQLTEALHKRPYQIILFDEIEKAHPDVWNLLLQLLDEGRLTDGRGKHVDFANTVIMMTSNLGSDVFDSGQGKTIGFGTAASSGTDAQESKVLTAVRRVLPAELWNRIEEKLVFHPLQRAHVKAIAESLLAESSKRLSRDRNIRYVTDDAVVEMLIDAGGFDVRLGARPMRQTIQRLVEGAIANDILSGRVEPGHSLRLTLGTDTKIVIEFESSPES